MLDKNLNLLMLFGALWRDRNVTRAAAALGITQPSLSRSLARLRRDFDDPLFVRGSRGVVPTPLARELAPRLLETLEQLHHLYTEAGRFDPSTVERVATIVTSDYFETLAASRWVPRLLEKAPGVTINFRTGVGRIPREEMERGNVDLVVSGIYEPLPEGFYQQALLSDPYRCALRKDHPVRRLTLDAYARAGHVLVTPRGDLSGTADRALEKVGRRRRIRVGVSQFLSAGWMAVHSDLVLSAPGRIIRQLTEFLPLKEHTPPVALPVLELYQVWHARNHADPFQRWLRGEIQAALGPERMALTGRNR